MTVLIALGALLTVATVWFLVRPPARATDAAVVEERDELRQLRERLVAQLDELDLEAGDRNVDTAVAGDERARLEAELAAVLRRLEAPMSPPPAPVVVPRRAWRATVVLLPLVAAALYGATQYPTLVALATLESVGPPDPIAMVARLEKRLTEQPGDAADWVRLGRAYVVLERFAEARAAFARGAAAAPDDVEILTEYATFLIAENPRHPTAEGVTVFRRIQQLNPKHPGALWVLGLEAYNAGRYAQAVQYWEDLRRELPPDSEVEPQIRQALTEARAQLRR